MFRLCSNETGMTLVEMLVALALTSVIFAGFMSVYWFASYAFEREYCRADIQYSARQAKDKIFNDVRESKSFSIPDGGTELRLIKTDTKVHYYVRNEQLYRDDDKSPPSPVACNIKGICFYSSTPGFLEITITSMIDECEFMLSAACTGRIE